MKKLLLLALVLLIMSCSLEDDSPNTYYELASITSNDLPPEFVLGKTYEIKLNYVLPSDCNIFQALDARRAGISTGERNQIYISIVTAVQENGDCNRDVLGPETSTKFVLTIDEEIDYTFRFWTGTQGNQPLYEDVTIPVVIQ